MIEVEFDSGTERPQTKSTKITQNDIHSYMMSTTTTSSNPPSINSSHHPPLTGHRPRSGSAREQTLQAVEYYNSNVLKARVGAGLSAPRNSAHERHFSSRPPSASGSSTAGGSTNGNVNGRLYVYPEHMYRSNSSLELQHDQHSIHHHGTKTTNGDVMLSANGNGSTLRREYGSHGSLDVISPSATSATTSESFFAMLQDYRPAVLGVIGTDQRSPGPAEFLKGKVLNHNQTTTGDTSTERIVNSNGEISLNQSNSDEHNNLDRPTSPKFRTKLHRLWGPGSANSHKSNNQPNKAPPLTSPTEERDRLLMSTSLNGQTNIVATANSNNNSVNMALHSASTNSADIEERQRRRAFAHYDCQSLTANLGYAAKLRGLLLARRRNTTTGASAASMMNARSATPDADSGDEDFGDGQSNELLENCPFFRSEVGGEEEREVSLTRMHSSSTKPGQHRRAIHRPALACGVSILESAPNETLWKQTCPFQKGPRAIETVDHGARYYRQHFHGEDHQNWFGMDEQLGPVAISVKREKLPEEVDNTNTHYQYRMIIRTSELLTLRGSIIEDSIPNPRGAGKPVTTKDVLEYVAPEIQLNCLRLGVNTPQCEQQLMKLDEQGLTNKYKVGILYCRAGQSSEEDMYNNEEAGPEFVEFLNTVGKRVRLKGFEQYRGGLDNKTDSTGTHSLYATYQDCEIMFHVSTMLPFTPNNRQQLLRKRHIGNDIVTIVFQEPGARPFTPKNIRSQFQHVFIIIQAVSPLTEKTCYRIAVSRSKEVPVFGPPIPAGATFSRGKPFADFLLAKIINAENAAHRSEKFATMATRTRQEYLKDLTSNYCTTTLVDTGAKFSIFPSKKKDKPKPRFSGDAVQRAAFCWQVVLQDSGLSTAVDCFLGISAETFVLIEECSRQLVFVTPSKAILGWSTCGNSLRIYHHQGECVTINMRDCGERDEQLEVIERLRSVTPGCGALELKLRRNPMGQLGFHVQPDGVVTQVETSGQAWTAGLRQGYRLVEICKVAVATLSHDQMVDLLKTSAQVTVTVIESFSDFTPRRGCLQQSCKFNIMNYENEYDATIVNSDQSVAPKSTKKSSNAQLQQPSANHRRRYDRNFSPPRSSNSSGYGTGSSSRSFSIPNEHVRQFTDMGTLTSSSSGHSSNDDRWYDILENVVDQHHQGHQTQQQQHHQQRLINSSGGHPKLMESSSLPLMSGNPRPLSIHDPTKVSLAAHEQNRPAPRMANVEYLITKAPTNQVHKIIGDAEHIMKTLTLSSNDGSNADSNSINHEPIYNKSLSTDDEMGTDMSPRLRRSATTSNVQKLKNSNGTVSSSTSSSRNNSPRPHSEALSASVAAKLRPGVTQRNHANLMQRNSVNYAGSSLQEDLMKLINPDYMTVDDNFINGNHIKNQKNIANSHSLGNISNIGGGLKAAPPAEELLSKKKSRSREGINLGQQPVPELRKGDQNSCDNEKAEVIFTTARPATVICQTNGSTQSKSGANNQKSLDDNILYISEGGGTSLPMNQRRESGASHRKKYESHAASQPLPLLLDGHEMDWSSLVDTATRAMMMQFHEEQRKLAMESGQQQTDDEEGRTNQPIQGSSYPSSGPSSNSNSSQNSGDYVASMPELQTHLLQLEDRMLRETRRRKSLEHAVRRLTEENRRLQDESQAAVQQLRRFTEWFFQTIDRQS